MNKPACLAALTAGDRVESNRRTIGIDLNRTTIELPEQWAEPVSAGPRSSQVVVEVLAGDWERSIHNGR